MSRYFVARRDDGPASSAVEVVDVSIETHGDAFRDVDFGTGFATATHAWREYFEIPRKDR
jgi:hypothetical protein